MTTKDLAEDIKTSHVTRALWWDCPKCGETWPAPAERGHDVGIYCEQCDWIGKWRMAKNKR